MPTLAKNARAATSRIFYSQNSRVDAAEHVSPEQHGGGRGGVPELHCCPFAEQLPPDVTVPFPLNETVCGLPVTLSAIVSVPLSAPLDPGVNVTDTVQLALMARLAPQLSVDANP